MRHRPPTTVEAPSPKPLEEAPAPEEAPAFEELPIEIEKRGTFEALFVAISDRMAQQV